MNGDTTQCVGCGRPVAGGGVICADCSAVWLSAINAGHLAAVFYDRDGEPIFDVGEAMDMLSTNRRVADDWLELGGERVRVLTSHLGIEHGFDADGLPYVFETVVIGGVDHLWVVRYVSEEAARAGHAIILAVYGAGFTLGEA